MNKYLDTRDKSGVLYVSFTCKNDLNEDRMASGTMAKAISFDIFVIATKPNKIKRHLLL